MRRTVMVLFLLGFCMTANAVEYFDKRFQPGYDFLSAGEFDQALESFNQLKTETPDSALVDYSIASTYYQKALALGTPETKETTIESLFQAKEIFEELIRMPEPFLQENAPFNSANCSAQIAKLYDPAAEYSQRVQGLRTAIEEFDKVLLQHPDNQSAQRNRDHLSYLLKSMLQDPPEEQQQPNEGDGGENQEEGDKEQEGQDPSEGENNENEDSGEEGEEDNSDGDPQDDDSENSDPGQQGEQPQQSSQNGKSPEEANIEAILESLEEINKDEQKNIRRARQAPQVVGGKWW